MGLSRYNARPLVIREDPKYKVWVPGQTGAMYPNGLPQVSQGLNAVPFDVGTGYVMFPEALPNTRAAARRRITMGLSGGVRRSKYKIRYVRSKSLRRYMHVKRRSGRTRIVCNGRRCKRVRA